MQTFLPYKNYERSARVLDNKRLGKQRVEAKQIFLALREPNYGWKHHPAVKMWAGYEYALCCYGTEMCLEWVRRGYEDSLLDFFISARTTISMGSAGERIYYPEWVSDRRVHRSHQSNLIRKDPVFYSDRFPGVPDNIPYYWPSKDPKYAIQKAA